MTLSRVPRLHDDELLSGFMVRLAHAHGLNAWRFASLHWPGRPLWRRDLDRCADPAWLEDLAALVGHPTERVTDATLRGPQSALRAERQGIMPLFPVVGIYHSKRRHHGLQFCPACLEESPGVYRRAWRCGLSVVCKRHETPLRDACPHCDTPLAPHRNDRLNTDACGRCTRSLLDPHEPGLPVPVDAIRLQKAVVADLLAARPKAVDTALSLRALLGVLATGAVEDRIRSLFALDPREHGKGGTRVFERMRPAERIEAIRSVVAWIDDWPERFRAGADAAKLSHLNFRGRRMGKALAEEVARLPERMRPVRRSPAPLVHTPEMRRLRRKDGRAYRARRAARLDELSRR